MRQVGLEGFLLPLQKPANGMAPYALSLPSVSSTPSASFLWLGPFKCQLSARPGCLQFVSLDLILKCFFVVFFFNQYNSISGRIIRNQIHWLPLCRRTGGQSGKHDLYCIPSGYLIYFLLCVCFSYLKPYYKSNKKPIITQEVLQLSYFYLCISYLRVIVPQQKVRNMAQGYQSKMISISFFCTKSAISKLHSILESKVTGDRTQAYLLVM